MKVLPIPFAIFTLCGFWRPVKWSLFYTKLLYNLFTAVMTFFIVTFTLSEVMDVFLSVRNLDEFAKNSFMMLSMINVCFKMTCVLRYRNYIINLIDLVEKDPFKPRDIAEQTISQKYNRSTRVITIYYAVLTEATVMCLTLRSFVDAAKGILPFRTWLPYNCKSPKAFWLTFLQQTIAHIAGGSIQVANETWIVGLMLQVSSQLQILEHRLANLPEIANDNHSNNLKEIKRNTWTTLRECIIYHKLIIRYAKTLNRVIGVVIFVQFSVSSLIICLSVYLLSQMPVPSAPFMTLLMYLCCMLYQIFLFCWYGNEAILKSLTIENVGDKMNWPYLNNRNKRFLLMVMLRATKPVKFTSSFLVTLSLQSFTKILKTAYSIFNIL